MDVPNRHRTDLFLSLGSLPDLGEDEDSDAGTVAWHHRESPQQPSSADLAVAHIDSADIEIVKEDTAHSRFPRRVDAPVLDAWDDGDDDVQGTEFYARQLAPG